MAAAAFASVSLRARQAQKVGPQINLASDTKLMPKMDDMEFSGPQTQTRSID